MFNYEKSFNKWKNLEFKKCYFYRRVSTLNQGNGTSLEDQKEICTKCCNDLKMEVIEDFEEKASAMQGGKRKKFNEMVEKVKNGDVKIIVTAYADRLTRNGTDGDVIKDLVKNYGVTIIFAHSRWMLQKPVDPMESSMFDMKIAFSNYRVLLDKERCNSGIVAKNKSGVRTTKPPYGYKLDSELDMVVTIPTQADFVKKAFELYETGNYSISEVGEQLYELGYEYEIQTSKKIPKQSLASLLKNPFYYGEYLVKQTNEYVKGKHEAIISQETFEKVQNLLGILPKAPRKHDLLYSKLLKCPFCGYCLTGDVKVKSNGKRYVYYRCTNSACKEHFSLNETVIDDSIAKYLREIRLNLIPKEIVGEVLKDELRGLVQDLSTLNRNVSRKHHSEMRFQEKIDKNGIVDDKYIQSGFAKIQEKYGDLDSKIYHTEKTIEMIKSKTAEVCEKPLYDVFSMFGSKEQRTILELVANTLKCSNDGLKMTFKSAFRGIRQR